MSLFTIFMFDAIVFCIYMVLESKVDKIEKQERAEELKKILRALREIERGQE